MRETKWRERGKYLSIKKANFHSGKFPRTEKFLKISSLKVENFQQFSANQILQNFYSAEDFPEWKWPPHNGNVNGVKMGARHN